MHLLTCYRSKFTIAAATLRRNPVLANTKQIVATAVPNTIGTQLIIDTPYGSDRFVTQASVRLKLKHTLRNRGRPKEV